MPKKHKQNSFILNLNSLIQKEVFQRDKNMFCFSFSEQFIFIELFLLPQFIFLILYSLASSNRNLQLINMSLFLLATVLHFIINLAHSNLICDGDFQYYSSQVALAYTPQYRLTQIYFKLFIPHNKSCWYLRNSTQLIQLKRIYNPPSFPTTACDLIGTYKSYYLCQTISLKKNTKYNISLDLTSNQNNVSGYTKVYLNNLSILQIYSSDYMQKYSGSTIFTSSKMVNQMCFYFNNTQVLRKGVNIDNITLLEVIQDLNTSSNLNMTLTIDSTIVEVIKLRKLVPSQKENNSIVIVETNYSVPPKLQQSFQREIQVYDRKQPEKQINFTIIFKKNSTLIIAVYKSIQLYNSLDIRLPRRIHIGNHIYEFISLQQFNQYNYDFSAQVMNWIKIIGRTFLCSYVLFDLIGLWNLLLLYYFLLIKTIPTFARIIISSLTSIFYSENSLLVKIPAVSLFIQSFQKSITIEAEQRDKIPQYIDSNFWFGNIGIYSNFFANNIEVFLLLLLLIGKLMVVLVVNNLCQLLLKKEKKGLLFYLSIFCSELISLSPQILVGATASLMHSSSSTFIYSLSFGLNLSVIGFINFIIFVEYRYIRKNKKQNEKIEQKRLRVFKSKESLYFNLLHSMIPILVSSNLKYGFFGLVLVILLARFRSFYNNSKLFKGFAYFKLLTIQGGWIIYHLIFLYFWLMEEFITTLPETQDLNIFMNLLGLFIVIFIFFTALLQVIQCLGKLLGLLKKISSQLQKTKRIKNLFSGDNEHKGHKKGSVGQIKTKIKIKATSSKNDHPILQNSQKDIPSEEKNENSQDEKIKLEESLKFVGKSQLQGKASPQKGRGKISQKKVKEQRKIRGLFSIFKQPQTRFGEQ